MRRTFNQAIILIAVFLSILAASLTAPAALASPVKPGPEPGPFALSAAKPAESHPFSIHDMLAMDRISDSQVSPDGKWIVFNMRETDLAANRGRTDVWIVGTDGKNLRRLTSHPAADFNARWAAGGKCIFFLSTRSGSAQVWRMKID